jgi:hypothetical protein
VQENPYPADEWTASGSERITFTDRTSMQFSLEISGFRSGDFTEIQSSGIVTKGHAFGALVSNETWFDPVLKSNFQRSEDPYPGYSYQSVLTMIPCTSSVDVPLVGASPGVTVNPNVEIRNVVLGQGADPGGINPDAAAGLAFYTGQP